MQTKRGLGDRRGSRKNDKEGTAQVCTVCVCVCVREGEWGGGDCNDRFSSTSVRLKKKKKSKQVPHRHRPAVLTDLLLRCVSSTSSVLKPPDGCPLCHHPPDHRHRLWSRPDLEMRRGAEERGTDTGVRAGSSCWDVSPLTETSPLLMLPHPLPPTHYHSVSLSLPPGARTLAPAAWQPLVSLTQLLCCLTHSQRCPPPTPPRHRYRCSSGINTHATPPPPLFRPFPSIHFKTRQRVDLPEMTPPKMLRDQHG